MKKLLFFLPLCICACGEIDLPEVQKPEEEVPAVEEFTKKFSFTIKGDFVNDVFAEDEEEHAGELGLHNRYTDCPMFAPSRANQYMTADGVEMTDLWVVDVVSGEIVQTLHQQPADDDWGAPQMSLTLGTHHIKFLASRGAEPTFSDGSVSWSRPLDTFFADYEVTVVKTSNGNRAVTLDRVAAKLQLFIDDAIPTGTTTFTTDAATWFCGWDMVKGEPIASPYSREFSVPSSWIGQEGASLTLWSLSGADEWTTNVQLTSKAGETQNASATITSPMKANRATVMHGNLYSANSSTSVSLNDEWLLQYEGVY